MTAAIDAENFSALSNAAILARLKAVETAIRGLFRPEEGQSDAIHF
jgi:hypothetical protein